MPPRVPTPAEWATLSGLFPGLVQANVWVTDDATPVYNCIAFSLGIVNMWINPPQPLATFQALYNGAPYNHPTVVTGAPGAQIDGWGTPAVGPTNVMTHGSRVTTSTKVGLWESKLGQYLRITHGRPELTGAQYGRTVTSFN
jgi:hypothetical protein